MGKVVRVGDAHRVLTDSGELLSLPIALPGGEGRGGDAHRRLTDNGELPDPGAVSSPRALSTELAQGFCIS